MVVQFDNKSIKQTVEHKTDPIGVEGDPSSMKKGGISEADAIVREAKKSMGDIPGDNMKEEEKLKVSADIVEEEARKEPGPELDPTALKGRGAAKQKI